MFGTDTWKNNVFLILNISPFSHKLQTRALLSGLLPYKPFHTSTHVLESWTKLRSSWHFCSEPSSTTPARQMVHVHQKPVSQAKQTSCDKPQTFLNKSKDLDHVPLSNLPDAWISSRKLKYSASCIVISHFCIQCHSANHQEHPSSV